MSGDRRQEARLPGHLVEGRERGQAEDPEEGGDRVADALDGEQQHERQARRTAGTSRR